MSMINNKTLSSLLTVGAITLGTLVSMGQPSLAQRSDKFFCGQSSDGTPTTFARRATGKLIALIRWEKAWGGEFTPQKRCEIVSRNFQEAYEQGSLTHLAVGEKNKYQVVCAMPRADIPVGECDHQLFTVRKGENANYIVQELRKAGSVAGSGPLRQVGGNNPWSIYELSGVFLED